MPHGAQQRKAKTKRKKASKTLAGSFMVQYGQGSSKNSQPPVDQPDSSDASMNSPDKQGVEKVEFEAEVQGVKMKEFEAEESTDSDSSHDEMSDIQEKELPILCDVSFWEIPVPDHFRVEIIKRGSASFQNKDGPFSVVASQDAKADEDTFQLSKEWFYITLPDGEKILRSWMVYSLISKNLYCFCCRLFSDSATDTSSKFVTGFQTWWKLSPEVHNHESAEEHISCYEKWKKMEIELRLHKTNGSESLIKMEKKKWRDILYRLLDIVLLLAKQNLPFRGDEEDESSLNEEDKSSLNKGNFLEMVELLSKYDPVLKEHLMRFKRNTWELEVSVPYLAPETQNEFISALANHVKERLVMDIKSAQFFGIMFDHIPDASDHMSEVIRYVKINNRKVEVKEVFLGYFPLDGKRAADLSSDILKNLERDGLDIMMCCGQGYYNAATMARISGGVQAILREKNNKAIFNGCVDHSLSLCCEHSFSEHISSLSFFGTLERMLSFFADSTHRCDVLTDHTGVPLRRLSTTCWSTYHAVVKPVKEKFDKFVAAIEALCDPSEDIDTRGEARCLLPAVCDFTFLCYLYLWCDVIKRVNLTQQYLQTKGLTLDKIVTKLEALRLSLHKKRSHLVERAIEWALLKSDECGIAVERRFRHKKRMAWEQASDAGLTVQEENKRDMLECIDGFNSELQIRLTAIREVAAMFEAVQVKSLISATEEELKVSIPKLTSFHDEVSESALLLEIPRLRWHLRAAEIDLKEAKDWAILDILTFIAEWNLVEFLPMLSLSLRLFLTICVSVASCERNLPKLKLIKNYLRYTMEQSCDLPWESLAILSVESELAKDTDFGEVIEKFAALKAGKEKF